MAEERCLDKKYSEWLVMVYLAGDNNLSAYSIAFLQELEAALCNVPLNECNRRARVVAAFDSPTPLPKGARYLEINRDKDPANPPRTACNSIRNFKPLPSTCRNQAPAPAKTMIARRSRTTHGAFICQSQTAIAG